MVVQKTMAAPGSLAAVAPEKVGAHGIQEATSRWAAGTASANGFRVAGRDKQGSPKFPGPTDSPV